MVSGDRRCNSPLAPQTPQNLRCRCHTKQRSLRICPVVKLEMPCARRLSRYSGAFGLFIHKAYHIATCLVNRKIPWQIYGGGARKIAMLICCRPSPNYQNFRTMSEYQYYEFQANRQATY